jgi:hypothetical protein
MTPVDVYWNLHKDCFSIRCRETGRVLYHRTNPFYVRDVSLVVQPAGRERVLREQRKNVHAFVRGVYVPHGDGAPLERPPWSLLREPEKCSRVAYNPYKAPFWYFDREGPLSPACFGDWALLRVVEGKPQVTIHAVTTSPSWSKEKAA